MKITIGPTTWDNIVGVFIWSPAGMLMGAINIFIAGHIAYGQPFPYSVGLFLGIAAFTNYIVYHFIVDANKTMHNKSIDGQLPDMDDLPPWPTKRYMTWNNGEELTCHVCGSSLVMQKVKIVERGFSYGNPWALIDTWWQCPHGHPFDYSFLEIERYEVRNATWVDTAKGLCPF